MRDRWETLQRYQTESGDKYFQLSRSNFESYCRDSALMKSLDKNNDGIVSELEMTSKHEMAFKVIVEPSNLLIPFHSPAL